MELQLLFFDECPSWRLLDERLREALAVAGIEGAPAYVEVTTAEQAERLGFRGSPTVLVDGRDPFAADDAPVGLTCRLFRTAEGLRGAPTVEQLLEVLR